jgi:phosphate:Na+ symporter
VLELSNIWQILAGLGIFLFGMLLLEESIRNLSGKALRGFIRRQTSNRAKAIFLGILTTVILQSSSAVSLMVLAFTGAGIMSTISAIGVVMGASMGTTISTWLLATVGFKFKIELLSLPFIGIGGLGLIFLGNRTSKWINISKILVGLGFIFMGMDYMKQGVEDWTSAADITMVQGLPGIAFLLFGVILSALIHSSTASIMIILSSVYSGMIDFSDACWVVVGINIGATITVLIGSINGVASKKKVAYSHIFFKIATALVVLPLLPILTSFINQVLNLESDPVLAVACFHTMFNLVGLLVFFPLIGWVARLLDKMFQEKPVFVSRFIHATPPEISEAATAALHNEVRYLLRCCLEYILRQFKLDPGPILPEMKDIGGQLIPLEKKELPEHYQQIKLLQDQIFKYAASIQKHEMTDIESEDLNRMLHGARNAVAAAKSIKDIQHNLEAIDDELYQDQFRGFQRRILMLGTEIASISGKTESFDLAEQLYQIGKALKKEDRAYIDNITPLYGNSQSGSLPLSDLLAINRSLTVSGGQIILSLNDLLLPHTQADVLENLGL